MKALILVGGIGAGLSPLTLSVPKPLVEFANKPIILHQIEALKAVGVTEVVLAIKYQPVVMMNLLKKYEVELDIKITYSCASESLGTAGPLALARDKLIDSSGEPFFVLNSDVICEYPLRELIDFHESHGGEASIMVRKVDELSEYGVVVMEESTGQVRQFVEKPELFVVDKGHAGIYLLNPSVLDRIELRKTYFETDVFPKMAADKSLYALVLTGFWMEIAQTGDHITGLRLYLDYLNENSSPKLAVGSVLSDKSAKTGEGCWNVPGVAAMPGVHINKRRCSENSIRKHYTFGEDFLVINEIYSSDQMVLPHKEIKSNILKPGDPITGLKLYVDYLENNCSSELDVGSHIVGNVLVDESAKIGEGCWIGPDVAIGAGCVIESHVKLSCCTVMPGAYIKKNSFIEGSIIGWRSTLGQCVHVINSILGEDVHAGDGACLRGVKVWPHVEIESSMCKPTWV